MPPAPTVRPLLAVSAVTNSSPAPRRRLTLEALEWSGSTSSISRYASSPARLELDREAGHRAAPRPLRRVGAGRDGFVLASADDNFQLRMRGYVQSDLRFFADDGGGAGRRHIRAAARAGPILEGTLFKNFDFRIMPDFGGGTTVLQDAYRRSDVHAGR